MTGVPISAGLWAGLGLLVPTVLRRRMPDSWKRAPRTRPGRSEGSSGGTKDPDIRLVHSR